MPEPDHALQSRTSAAALGLLWPQSWAAAAEAAKPAGLRHLLSDAPQRKSAPGLHPEGIWVWDFCALRQVFEGSLDSQKSLCF